MASKNPFQGDDKDPFSGARDKDGGIKKQTFGQAFAAARRAGKKNFTFNGKSYTTQTKEDQQRATKKRDDAAFAAEDARSKTARAVAGDGDNRQRDAEDRRRMVPIAAQGRRDAMANQTRAARARNANVAATRKDAETAGDKRFVKDVVRGSEKTRERKRMQDDIDTAAAKRKVSSFAEGGKVRGYGMARGGKKCKIV